MLNIIPLFSQIDEMVPTSATARELHALVMAAQGLVAGGGAEDLKGVAAALMTELGSSNPQTGVRNE